MPLTRYQIRNEYSLADPELHRAADKDDPEALLEGVAMAGLVGVLRQLGDLAEFAAEIFHDLHEEVMATAARGHGLVVRVQQLEAEVPPLEKALLSQTNHASFFTNAGVEWHPNLHTEQNLITHGDLPRCVMDSYEECRAPPRLFLLDKFDVAGVGACLKRYTDPSFFKVESASYGVATVENQREKKIRKGKKKGSRWRNGETPEVVPSSHAKLHQLFLEERIENAYSDPTRRVKLKRRQLNASPLDPKYGKSYMEKFLETPSPEHKMVYETSVTPPLVTLSSDQFCESGLEIIEISTVSPLKKASRGKESTFSSPNAEELVIKPFMEESNGDVINGEIVNMHESIVDGHVDEIPSAGVEDRDHSVDLTSEIGNYMDALDYQSVVVSSSSDDGNNSFKRGISSLSYSDTVSNLAENAPSDNEETENAFPFAESCASETLETPFIQHTACAQTGGPSSNGAASSKETFLNENWLCEVGEEGSSYPTDLLPPSVSWDIRVSPVVAASVEHEVDEIPFNGGKHDSELSNTDENGTSLCNSPEAVSVDPYERQDDTTFTVSAEKNSVDELDIGNVNTSSNGVLHLSNISQLAPGKGINSDSLDEVIQMDHANENDAENYVNQIISSPKPVTSPTEEQLTCSTLTESEMHLSTTLLADSGDVVKLGNLNSEGSDAVSEGGGYSEDTSLLTDSLPACSFDEQQLLLHDFPQVKTDSRETEASNFEPKTDVDEVSEGAETEEIEGFTHSVDVVERGTIPHDLDSDIESEKATETVQAEDVAVSTAVVAASPGSDDISNSFCQSPNPICSPSRNLMTLEQALFGTLAPHVEGSKINVVLSQEFFAQLETPKERHKVEVAPADNEISSQESHIESVVQNEMNQAEVVPTDSDFTPLILNNYSNVEDVVSYCYLAEPTKNNLSIGHETAPAVSSELSDQELGLRCFHESHLEDNIEDVVSSTTFSGPGTSLDQSANLQTELTMGNIQVEEENFSSSNHLSRKTDSQVDQERCLHASVVHFKEDSLSQPSAMELLPQLAGKEFESNKQGMDSADSVVSTFGLLPEATQVSMEEMPPLPPLPPMQWRIGKVQHNSVASHRELVGQGSFPGILQHTSEQKAQFGLSAFQGGFVQPESLFSNLACVEEEKSCHASEQLVANMVQPTPFLMNLPAMVDNSNSQYCGISLDRTQSVNSFSTLPEMYKERPEAEVGSEGKRVQSNDPLSLVPAIEHKTSRVDPLSLVETPTQPQNQFVLDTSSEIEVSQHSTRISDGEHDNPTYLDVPSLSETQAPVEELHLTNFLEDQQQHKNVEEQPQHGLVTSEGEIVQTSNAFPLPGLSVPEGAWSSKTFSLSQPAEVGKANGNPSVKMPRPRNPLIDAVAAHDKSKMRKVTERVLPQIAPKVDERNSLLEQIRSKSFNLRPAVVTRPSIRGPKTNLKVAAILEKANSIRQALAGSDEDEDAWSDS
ncbi:hypothetical protein SLEP1_g18065 [Rubroshorea leprosula]|uniref:Protein SCAR n=1 Tax=Rubroshorea leprosula TaxID=152421 RepID=A0AAV5IW99_9ROSI|nr:hypothetical protein SLEP1_g18065 [Rubroshorea leprosula]